MNITFYINNSDNTTVDKNLTFINTVEGNIKGECNVSNPSILVEGSSYINCNYCYIEEFKRYYYFRTAPTVYRNNLWLIDLKCDVLMSFRNEIRGNNAVIDKQESLNNSNTDIDDGSFVFENKITNEVVNFPGSFNDNGEYILLTAGGIG